ncbi:pyruvate dehydrogenase complex dihydrolipoamide acetyltransferase [soil metagenome]
MIEFALPSLGADMDEGMLVAWLVQPGDRVEYGQIIAEVETDKGIIEIECWHDGIIEELLCQPSLEKLPVGTSLARIRLREEETPSPLPQPVLNSAAPQQRPPSIPPRISPPVRHLAHTLGVDLDCVVGSGIDDSVTREDVRRAAAPPIASPPSRPAPVADGRAKATPRARAQARDLGVDLKSLTSSRSDGLLVHSDLASATAGRAFEEREDRVAVMRKAITRSMSRSKREIPHYYLASRIDMSRALDWLEELNTERPITQRVLPAVLLLKASALAVREIPDLNGRWLDESFVPSESVHLGVAISLREGGLVAPAIHDADQLGLDELMERLRDLVSRARTWRLRGSEMSDPTVTVTNLGDRGVDLAFPIIIPPQVAMVGFGKIIEEVVAVDGEPVVHPVVHATLAADHRVTDGHTGGLFLTTLDRLLQKPEEL